MSFEENYYYHKKDIVDTYIGTLSLAFFIVVLIIWSIIVLISPSSFHSGERGLDRGKVFCATLLISVVIIVILSLAFSWMFP